MKRGTRAWHDPRTGLHADTGEDRPDHEGSELVSSTSTNCLSTTLELLSSSQSEQAHQRVEALLLDKAVARDCKTRQINYFTGVN